ncbi:MAG: hydrogenase maturation protease [Spirochaetia bacterium]
MSEKSGLVLAFGNPVRGDDGIGPAAAEYLENRGLKGITVDCNYQLSLEDALEVAEHDFTVFIDASLDGEEPFTFTEVEERNDPAVFSHALEPSRVMGLANDLFRKERTGYMLGIRGYDFTMFSEGLTEKAQDNMKKAMDFITAFLNTKMQTGG